MIVGEVGGVLASAHSEIQIELFDSLIEGCKEAIKEENITIKVC